MEAIQKLNIMYLGATTMDAGPIRIRIKLSSTLLYLQNKDMLMGCIYLEAYLVEDMAARLI